MNNKKQFIDVYLTDVQMHVTKPRKPISLGRALAKSLKSKKGGRVQSRNINISKNNEFTFSVPLGKELTELIEKAKQEGKQVRLITPKSGLPIFLGQDTVENIKARKRKVFDRAAK